MIWESKTIMTLIDLAILAAVFMTAGAFWRLRKPLSLVEASRGFPLLLTGLGSLGLLYGVDLILTNLGPGKYGHLENLQSMHFPHIELSWFIMVFTAVTCCASFYYLKKNLRSKFWAGKEDLDPATEGAARELKNVNRRLQNILKAAQQISKFEGMEGLYGELLEAFAKNMAATGGSIYECTGSGLILIHTIDPGHAPKKIEFPLNRHSVFAKVLQSKKPILVKNTRNSQKIEASGWEGYRNSTFLAIPLQDENGEVVAIVSLHSKTVPPFTEQDRYLALILAAYTCEIIRKNRSHTRLVDAVESLPLSFALYDKDDRLVLFNKQTLEMFALHKSILRVGTKYKDIVEMSFEEGLLSGVAEDEDKKTWVRRRLEEHQCKPNSYEQLWADGRTMATFNQPTSDGGTVSIRMDITDQKRAEAQLRSKERLLQTVFDSIPHSVFVKDSECRYLLVNNALAKVFDRSPEEVIGKHADELVAGDREEKEIYRKTDLQVLKSGQNVDTPEFAFTLANGTQGFRQMCKVPLKDEHGEVVGLVGIAEDITDRVIAEKQLRLSEEKFRILAEGSLQGIIVHRNFKPLYVNQAFAEMLGYSSPQEILSIESLLELIAPHERPQREKYNHELLSGKKTKIFSSFEGIRKDGTSAWRESVGRLVPWDGEPAILTTTFDITERKRVEEALQKSERLLQTVFDTIPHTIAIKDSDARYLKVNKAWSEFYGIPEEAALGKTAIETRGRLEEENRGAYAEDQLTLKFPGKLHIFERQRTNERGEERVMHDIRSAIRDEGGQVVGLVSVSMDITDRIRTKVDLARKELLLRTVLNSIPSRIVVRDSQGKIVLANKAPGQVTGLTAEEFVTLPEEYPNLSETEIAELKNENQQVLNTGEPLEIERVRKRSDGGEEYLHITKVPLIGPESTTEGLVIITRDITQQKKADLELAAGRNLLRTVIDSVPNTIVVQGVDGKYLLANKAMGKTFGMSADEIVGHNNHDLPGQTRAQADIASAQDRKVIETKQPVDCAEFLHHLPDGTLRISRVYKAPVLDDSNEVKAIVAISQDITPYKKLEEELRAGQRLLQTVFDTIPAAVFVKDLEGRFSMVNPILASRFGANPEQFAGRFPTELGADPESEKRWTDSDQTVILSGKAIQFPVERVSIEGQNPIWRQLSKAPLRDGEGNIIGVVGVGIDITELKQAEEALQESQRILQTVFDTIPHHLYVKDTEGRYVMVNQAATIYFGQTAQEMLHRPLEELRWPDENTMREAAEHDQLVMRTNQPQERPEVRIVQEGREYVFRIIKLPLHDKEGNVTGVVGISEDITQQKKSEGELQESEAKYRDLVETSHELIWKCDQDGRFTYLNPAWERSHGYRIEEMLGRPFTDFQPPEFSARDKEQFRKHLKGGSVTGYETIHTSKNGQQIHLIFNVVPLFDSAGAIIGTQGTAHDITDRKTMEEQLRQAQKMEAIGQLAGGVAHDFNNMLQIIRGYTELAILNGQETGADVNSLEKVLGSAKRAGNLTRQLLAFSRQNVLQPVDININDLIEELMKMVGRLIGENIQLELRPGQNLGNVYADPGMIEQVLMNLCVNARDAMPEGGRLIIETANLIADEAYCQANEWAEPGKYVEIAVRDTGLGIPIANLEHVFDPFFTTKEVGVGTGLGLSVCYGIVEQHKGKISLESEPGRGTTFTITLPVSELHSAEQEIQPVELLQGGDETILVAEDEELLLEMLTELLEEQGYQVLSATDGAEACSVFKQHSGIIELVILDVVMPNIGGREAYEIIKEINPSVPIIFCTGYSANSLDEEFIEAERPILIKKPYSRSALFSAVRNELGQCGPNGTEN